MGTGTALDEPCSLPVCWEPHSGQDKPELLAAGLLELVQAWGWCPVELSRKHQLTMISDPLVSNRKITSRLRRPAIDPSSLRESRVGSEPLPMAGVLRQDLQPQQVLQDEAKPHLVLQDEAKPHQQSCGWERAAPQAPGGGCLWLLTP